MPPKFKRFPNDLEMQASPLEMKRSVGSFSGSQPRRRGSGHSTSSSTSSRPAKRARATFQGKEVVFDSDDETIGETVAKEAAAAAAGKAAGKATGKATGEATGDAAGKAAGKATKAAGKATGEATGAATGEATGKSKLVNMCEQLMAYETALGTEGKGEYLVDGKPAFQLFWKPSLVEAALADVSDCFLLPTLLILSYSPTLLLPTSYFLLPTSYFLLLPLSLDQHTPMHAPSSHACLSLISLAPHPCPPHPSTPHPT